MYAGQTGLAAAPREVATTRGNIAAAQELAKFLNEVSVWLTEVADQLDGGSPKADPGNAIP